MEDISSAEGLSIDELSRIVDIASRLEKPEFVSDLVMPAYWLNVNQNAQPEEYWYITMYDQAWEELTAKGVHLPTDQDPRRNLTDDSTMWGKLTNRALYQKRSEAIALVIEDFTRKMAELRTSGLDAYIKLVEDVGQADADFLLGLVGGRIVEQNFVFIPVAEKKLEAVHDLIPMMEPTMRDFARVNAPLVAKHYPAWTDSVSGTPMDDNANEKALVVRRFYQTILGQNSEE